MKKVILLLLILPLVVACGQKKDQKNVVRNVSILKFTSHPALDELENGFIIKLNSLLQTNDSLKSIEILKYNAEMDTRKAKIIAENLVNNRNNLLSLAIATPAAIALATTPSNKPFVYGAVADPYGAKIVNKDSLNQNITGIQNSGPQIIKGAIEFIKIAFPSAHKIGTLFNPSEQNSVYVQNLMKQYCDSLGFELIQKPIYDISKVQILLADLCENVDVVYSANDNTVNSAISTVVNMTLEKNKPFIIGDLSTLQKGALIAVGLEYYSMGEDLALMAYNILKGEKISTLPPRPAPNPKIWLNREVLLKMNLNLPDSILLKFDKTIN